MNELDIMIAKLEEEEKQAKEEYEKQVNELLDSKNCIMCGEEMEHVLTIRRDGDIFKVIKSCGRCGSVRAFKE